MGLFNFFHTNQKQPTENQPTQDLLSTTQGGGKDAESNDNNLSDPKKIITIQYGTHQPIDLIYAFLRDDYESIGYDDAMSTPDVSYKEQQKDIIKSKLEVMFKQFRRKYRDNLRQLDFHIKSRSDAGLVDVVEQLKTERETLLEHMEELDTMEKDFRTGATYMTGMHKSYDRGFLRGMAAISLGKLNNDNEAEGGERL